MKKLLILLLFLLLVSGCTKMEDKKTSDKTNTSPQTQKDPHSGMNMQKQSDEKENTDAMNIPKGSKDAKADELSNTANDFDKVYEKNKNETNKKQFIDKHLAAGLYLMYEAKLNPTEKYGPALKHFNKVLEADPNNQEAKQNKQMIEDIYNQMGRPIPQ